ncbi:MAG: ABC transporter ATP-binding protein [Bacteroidales bacterium]|nr:ABC transporter ATP-binding protein [Bacteroidales bacterium]
MTENKISVSPNKIVAQLEGAVKKYKTGDTIITALKPTSHSFEKNKLTLILGPSGSGKTTLLSILGSVIYPTEGTVKINGQIINNLSQRQLADLRLNNIGFVFQYFNLISPLNALENVMEPLKLMGSDKSEAKKRALEALNKVGMTDRANSLPKNLSGGQQQRVAIARALVTDPPIVLCDEPTASLDHDSVKSVLDRLKKMSEEDRAVIVVTHDERLKPYADEIVYIQNGEISEVQKELKL